MAETMDKKASNKLPPLTLSLIVLSAVLVGGVILLVLYPQYKTMERMKHSRETAAINLKEQQKLFPMFVEAQALASLAFEPELPLTERSPLERGKISSLTEIFSGIAEDCDMELSGNTLDINSLRHGNESVAMELTFTGELFSFRKCLVVMISLPYVGAIESVDITPEKGKTRKCFTKILINIDEK